MSDTTSDSAGDARPALPSQTQLLLPLLDVLRENGPMRANAACAAVAEKIHAPPRIRDMRGVTGPGGRQENLFDRQVRWTRQNAVIANLIPKDAWGVWQLTEDGERTYHMAQPSVVITVYQSGCGSVLWAEAKAALQIVERGSATCVLVSPPFPLVKPRPYDADVPDWRPEHYIETLLDHVECVRSRMTVDGSFVLNLGPTFLEGQGARNPYQHRLMTALVDRLGWSIIDEHFWFSPCKPRGGNQVTTARTHCVNGIEQFYILSPTGHTKCNTLRVLKAYSDDHRRRLATGGEVVTRLSPSKIGWPGVRHRKDNGGSIPYNLHVTPPDPDRPYRNHCKRVGVPANPSMMPLKLAEFFIELTTEPGDLVVDFCAGSLKTAMAAYRLDRRFIASDRCLEYLRGGMCRLPTEGYLAGAPQAQLAG